MKTIPYPIIEYMKKIHRPYMVLDKKERIAWANRSVVNFFKFKHFNCERAMFCPLVNENITQFHGCHRQINSCPVFYNQPIDDKRLKRVFEYGEPFTMESVNLGKEFDNKRIYLMVHKLSSDIAGLIFDEN